MYSERQQYGHYSIYRDAVYLSKCSEKDAFVWLKSRNVNISLVFGTPETPAESHILEYILYRRRNDLIDLALAEYGLSKSVLERVYKRGNAATRVVGCSNASLFFGETVRHRSFLYSLEGKDSLLWTIVQRGPKSELRAICENPNLHRNFYKTLVGLGPGSEDSDDEGLRISERRFTNAMWFLGKNPRLAIPREKSDERYYWDGFADVSYSELAVECWKLAERVPVNVEWALILERLFSDLYKPYAVFDDIEFILSRWRLDESSSSPEFGVRYQLARKFLTPNLDMLNSDDSAIRSAFYSEFDPQEYKFRDLDWEEWLEKDKYCYLDLQNNLNIWKKYQYRSKLESLMWAASKNDSDITSVGFLRQQKDHYRKTNPEWFVDEDNEFLSEPESEPLEELAKLEELLAPKLNDLQRTLNVVGILVLCIFLYLVFVL